MTCFASIEQKIGSIQLHSHQSDAQGTVVRLSKVCTQRFRPIFSDLEFRLCSSNTLQVGAFFDDNYLLTERESGKTVLVNPQNSMFLHLIASRHSPESQLWASNFVFKIEPVGFQGIDNKGHTIKFASTRKWFFLNVKSELFNSTKTSFVFNCI